MQQSEKDDESQTLQDRSVYLLLLIAQTFDTTGFSAEDVAVYFGKPEIGHRECLSWLLKNNYIARVHIGMTNYCFTEKAELFLSRVVA